MAVFKASSEFIKQFPECMELLRDKYGEVKEIRHMRRPHWADGEGAHELAFHMEVKGFNPGEDCMPEFTNKDGETTVEIIR